MKKSKGITLIALVITIIILLILAGISIMSLTNTGIFGKAQDAKTKSAEAEANQKATLDEYETELNKYGAGTNGGNQGGGQGGGASTVGDSTVNQVISTSENKEITDAKGNKIVVPAGFKIVKTGTNYENTANNEITVDKGIVVEDATGTATNGSQFVWIPVGTITKADGSTTSVNFNRYTFDASDGTPTAKNDEVINSYYQELALSSNGNTVNAPYCDKEITIREVMHVINAKVLIAGGITPEVYNMANDEYIEIIDIMKREELAVLNTIATAEGTIQIAIENTNKILHGSEVLILGFGRIGKVLARKLAGLSVKVTAAARKDEDLAWIQAYGHKATNINNLGENLSKYDVIINTVPHTILTEEKLAYIKKDCLLIDLASNPGGIDKKAVKDKNLKFVWALSLPGKVAPTTSAEFIKDTIYNIIKEIYKS